jgi:hypothetical protein
MTNTAKMARARAASTGRERSEGVMEAGVSDETRPKEGSNRDLVPRKRRAGRAVSKRIANSAVISNRWR